MLRAAGISQPRALAVVYKGRQQLVHTVHALREHFPKVSSACSILCAGVAVLQHAAAAVPAGSQRLIQAQDGQ